MNEINRIFLIGIDSIIFDRTSFGGNDLNVCPTLKWLAEEGINCVNNYSHSGPTQFSLPSVFTSTLPLDFNGYDKGIIERPNSLVEVLKKNAFSTFAVLPNFWASEFGGYDRGFDFTSDGYCLSTVWDSANIYINYFDNQMSCGNISKGERNSLVLSHLEKLMIQTKVYCEKVIQESGQLNTKDKFKDIYKFNYEKILKKISLKIETASEAEAVLRDLVNSTRLNKKIRNLFYKNYVSADWSIDSVLKRLDHNKSKKTMSFAFLEDLHELNTCRGYGAYFRSNANKLLASIPSSDRYRRIYKYLNNQYRDKSNSILYDASLKYIDNALKRFLCGLRNRSMLNESLIVIFSDHGTSFNDPSGITATFQEDYLKVPMIFWSSELQSSNVETLTSLFDLAPTVLDLSKIKIPETYKGLSVMSEEIKDREYIIHENAGLGPCDIVNKKLNVGLRDKNSLLWTTQDDEIKDSYRQVITKRKAKVKKYAQKLYHSNGGSQF